jgi:hypothetical protein
MRFNQIFNEIQKLTKAKNEIDLYLKLIKGEVKG